jgi:hypothetical protein
MDENRNPNIINIYDEEEAEFTCSILGKHISDKNLKEIVQKDKDVDHSSKSPPKKRKKRMNHYV